MRRCNIPPPSCRHKYSTPCCRDCREADCESRCQNSPERCFCWSDRPPGRKKQRPSKLDYDAIFRLNHQGLSQADIARQLGCSTSGVSAALRKNGGGGRG